MVNLAQRHYKANEQMSSVALDHFIFLSADHIRRVVSEYVRYDNGARPSQAVHGIPDPYPELRLPPPHRGSSSPSPYSVACSMTIDSPRRLSLGLAATG